MLLTVVLLSRRAIRPVAENMEKQRQFVTNAGHEIKTPLAIIQSNTDAMELYLGENKWTRNIREQTERLSGLMQNLLLLARMEEGGAPLQTSDVSLSRLTEESVHAFAETLEQQRIRLRTQIAPEVHLRADCGQLQQLLSILLDNMAKYTPQGGEAEVRLEKNGTDVILTAENTCDRLPALPPERLFERFCRGDAARTQKTGGCGIGLSAAAAITEANHGTISAEYILPDRIRFTVRF